LVALVVFDLDGTLVDSAADIAASLNAALERLAPGTPPVPFPQVRSFIGDGATMLVTRALAATRIAVPTETALPVFLECYSQRLLDTTALYPGVIQALDALRDRTLAVLTNKPGDMSRRILTGLGVGGRFAGIYGGGDVPAKKPDPAGLRLVLQQTGVPPESAVIVGDSAIDVRTGRAAGVRTAGVTYGLDPSGFEAARPDILVGDLRDLAPRLAALPRLTVLP
jgi:phosphoglycolate phosphatase